MTQTAKILADSISPYGPRLLTFQCRYPKFIHGEAKTHRKMRVGDRAYEFLEEVGLMDYPEFSRNASSSRAIPVERLIQDVIDDPVIPIWWGKNQPGMQADEELDDKNLTRVGRDGELITTRARAIELWLQARDRAVNEAMLLHSLGAHKQIVNRLLEPWAHINVVITATELNNFYALRRHPAAQPEMRALADAMWEAQEASVPKLLKPGQWHLPYVRPEVDVDKLPSPPDGTPRGVAQDGLWFTDQLIKLSVARCARVSYMTHDGRVPNVEEDLKLYDRLLAGAPLHASPAEHQATPDAPWMSDVGNGWKHAHQHGNLVGWRQYRKMLSNENVPG